MFFAGVPCAATALEPATIATVAAIANDDVPIDQNAILTTLLDLCYVTVENDGDLDRESEYDPPSKPLQDAPGVPQFHGELPRRSSSLPDVSETECAVCESQR
jgi:hypothetical protein